MQTKEIMYDVFHGVIVSFGTLANILMIFVILLKTPKNLKNYSVLLLNTGLNELLSIAAHALTGSRLFVSSHAIIIMSNGSCHSFSPSFCYIIVCFMSLNMIHSITLLAVSFWYRNQILLEKGPIRKLKIQNLCILLYVPPAIHLVLYVQSLSPRNELEPIVDRFYYQGYSATVGLYGYSDVTEPIHAYLMSYLAITPLFLIFYICITRHRLLSVLHKKTAQMSDKTRRTHEVLQKALTIQTVLPIISSTAMGVLTYLQEFHDIHSIIIERLEHDFAIMPALFNPVLILYFVQPYRIFIQRLLCTKNAVEPLNPNL